MPRKKKIIVNTPQKEKFVPKEEEFVPKEEDPLKQFGKKIREARIAKNLSLESVSGHLHIAVKILEAIEEGEAEKGPKPVFLRGLVRTYCNYLGIDKNDVVDKIEEHLKSDTTGKQELKTLKPIFEIKESHPIRNIVVLLVLLAGGYLLYATYSYQIPSFFTQDNHTQSKSAIVAVEERSAENENNFVTHDEMFTSTQSLKQSKQKTVVSKNIIPQNIEPSSIEDSNQLKSDSTRRSDSNADTVTEKTEKNEVLTKTDKTSEKLDVESQMSLTDPNKTNISELSQLEVVQDFLEPLTLEVEASEGTWISISVDGNEAKDIRLSTDEIHQWEAKKEYLLTLGNTHAVRILLNGREIETNRTHQLLKDWLIDKSFLP